jgi:serine/threonine protein kinase/Flp pilus assembly protein TadD
MIGQTISHYKILEKLGEGGMGVVYKAHDVSLDRMVALKFLPQYLTSDATEKERFYHEARAASALNHPNITTIHEIQEFNGQLYLAMELVEGRTLKQLIEAESPSIKRVLDIAIQVCDGLNAAHEKGVVHRDIKSDNIMVTPKGQVKIMDFGLAKVKGATKLTKAGSTIGTAAYMSPEQAQAGDVDHRSDIFSFGVVLYELLTTKLPFRGEHQAALMYSLINEEPQPIARFNNHVTPELERVVIKALAKDPEDRYQHIDEMLADLRRERKQLEYARAGYATTSTITQQVQPAAPAKPRRLLKYLLPAGAIVVAAVLLLIFNPFNFQITTQKSTAGTAKNSLAVLYFENIPDPEDKDHTGEMLTNLLTTALFQTNDLEVISHERLNDIQKELGQADQKSISPSMGTRIAQRAGVSMMLLGSVLQKQPSLLVTYRLVDVQSGRILSTQRLSGFTSDRVFSLVDTLALLVKNDLRVTPQPVSEAPSVAQVTTSSPEAYRSYLEGVELNSRFYTTEAKAAFERAIELDSNFAMAYFGLVTLSTGGAPTGLTLEETMAAFKKAYALSQRLPDNERLIIQSTYAAGIENNFPKAIEGLETLLKKYPLEQTAYQALGIMYDRMGRFDKAVDTYSRGLRVDSLSKGMWNSLTYACALGNRKEDALAANDHYVRLAPAEPNPYDSRGDVYAMFDDRESAIQWWEKAISFRPDFASVGKLAFSAFARGDYESGEKYFRRFAASTGDPEKYYVELLPAVVPVQKGQLVRARNRFLELLGPHSKLKDRSLESFELQSLITLDYELKDYGAMIDHSKEYAELLSRNPTPGLIYGRMTVALAYLKNGNADASNRMVREIDENIQHSNPGVQANYQWGMADLALQQGKYEAALDLFAKASQGFLPHHAPEYHHALCLLKGGRRPEAILEFERLAKWSPILHDGFDLTGIPLDGYSQLAHTKAHYWLGIAYEEQGEKDHAIREYRQFLERWKEADFKSDELLDAKARLARLQPAHAG